MLAAAHNTATADARVTRSTIVSSFDPRVLMLELSAQFTSAARFSHMIGPK
jgi:hypothetical protein